MYLASRSHITPSQLTPSPDCRLSWLRYYAPLDAPLILSYLFCRFDAAFAARLIPADAPIIHALPDRSFIPFIASHAHF